MASMKKIIIVEDAKSMVQTIRGSLKGLGLEVLDDAPDGIPAWEMIQKAYKENQSYDLVIADWNMPGMEGLELLEKLRGDERFQALPFLMVTAESDRQQIIKAIKSGVNGYIVKPFSSKSLQEKVQSLLSVSE